MKRDVMCGTHARERIGALIQRLRPTRPKDLEILVKVCGDNMKPTKMAGSASWPRATPRGRRAGATGARRCGASASPSSASQKERFGPRTRVYRVLRYRVLDRAASHRRAVAIEVAICDTMAQELASAPFLPTSDVMPRLMTRR